VLTAAQIAYNVALNANPIGIVIVAIAAFVAAVIVAYEKSETFRKVIEGIGEALRTAFNFLKNTVIGALTNFYDAITTAFVWIRDKAGPILDGFKDALTVAFAPISLAVSAMQKLLDLLGSWKGKGGSPNLNRPGLPGGIDNNPATPFEKGGIVTQPTFALIGEAGPEAVIPLNRAGAFGGITINVQAGLVANPDQIGQQIIEAIQRAQRRSGPVFAPA
jgi:Flp pilus assembly pilin Flp